MDIKIQIGDYEVLNTGTTIALEGVPILFTIGELKISFVFITKQEDDAEMTINKRVISSFYIKDEIIIIISWTK